jgi:adenylate kinase family enzyme
VALVERLGMDGGRVRPALSAPRRIAVVGGPGSGKTTLSGELARRLDLVHLELDGLWWRRGWQHVEPDQLRRAVAERLADGGWVADGTYLDEVGRDLVWPAADTIVWLDMDRRRAFARTVRRTLERLVRRQTLWDGNVETWHNLGPANLVRVWQRWPDYGRRIDALLDEMVPGDDRIVIRLRSDLAVRAWLAELAE